MAYLVKIENWHQDRIVFRSGVELYQDTWTEFREKVTLRGEVLFSPVGGGGIGMGDRIIFRYDVVGDIDIIGGRMVYHNQVWIDGQVMWRVEEDQVLAVDRDGKVEPYGDWVIGRHPVVESFSSSVLVIPEHFAKVEDEDVIELPDGDRWVIDRRFASRYNFDAMVGEDVIVIRKKYLIEKIVD